MSWRVVSLTALACASMNLGCELAAPSGFGAPCNVNADCPDRTLLCDREQKRCLPPAPDPPPSTAGRSCDEPLTLALAGAAVPLLRALDVVPTEHNTTDADETCGRGRTFFVALEIPVQLDPAGVPRPGIVVRARVDGGARASLALLDDTCASAGPYTCAAAGTTASTELVLPLVEPGRYHLAVTTSTLDVPLTVTFEQVVCPPGFLPDEDGCLGFVPIARSEPRVAGYRLDALDGDRVVLSGGLASAEPSSARADAEILYVASGQRLTVALSTARAFHSSVIGSSGTYFLLSGGVDSSEDRDIVDALGPDASRFEWDRFLSDFPFTAFSSEQCLTVPGAARIELFVSCRNEGALHVYREGGDDAFNYQWFPSVPARPDDATDRGGGIAPLRSLPGAIGALLTGGFDSKGRPAQSYVYLDLEPFDPRSVEGAVASWIRFPGEDAEDELRARSDATFVSLPDGVAIVGGIDASGEPLGDVEIARPLSTSFIARATLASARVDAAAALWTDTELLVVGGFDGTERLASSEIVDLSRAETRAGPSFARAVSGATAVRTTSGVWVLAGGETPDEPLEHFYRLDRIPPTLDPPASVVSDELAGEECANAIPIPSSGTLDGSLFRYNDQLSATMFSDTCTDGFPAPGPDVVYSVEVPADHRLDVSLESIGDLTVYALSSCEPDAQCLDGAEEWADNAFGELRAETLSVAPASTTRTIFLVVDTYYPLLGADFRLSWSSSEAP